MKHNTHLLSAAILIGLAGVANATIATGTSNDGFIVEATAHPHEDTKAAKHQVWIQQMSDGEHLYELRMEDGVYTVSIDGNQVPNDQVKKTDSSVIILDGNGGEIYEFDLTLAANGPIALHNTNSMYFSPSNQAGHLIEIVGSQNGDDLTMKVELKPKVMLGVYTDEPGESLRKHLGIKGHAILIERVIEGLSADQAGIKDHDIIISINGSDGVSPEELTEILTEKNPGDEIKIVVLRNGQEMKVNTKLFAYNAEALGRASFPNGGKWIGMLDPTISGTVRVPPAPPSPNQFYFSPETRELTHQKILDALRKEGIGEKKIAEIERQIRASLEENVWKPLAENGSAARSYAWKNLSGDDPKLANERFLVENMQQKAEDAMRHAERMTLEFKDGQLLLKRHAKVLEDKLQTLKAHVQDSIPEAEAELQSRLVELEDRLDQLESALDSKMDSLSGLIEQLINRLDED